MLNQRDRAAVRFNMNIRRSSHAADGPTIKGITMQPVPASMGVAGEDAYWSIETRELLQRLGTSASGLATSEAASRLAKFGRNTLASRSGTSALTVFVRQFRSPLVLILIFAAIVSAFV